LGLMALLDTTRQDAQAFIGFINLAVWAGIALAMQGAGVGLLGLHRWGRRLAIMLLGIETANSMLAFILFGLVILPELPGVVSPGLSLMFAVYAGYLIVRIAIPLLMLVALFRPLVTYAFTLRDPPPV